MLDLAPAYQANGFLVERKHARPRAETKTVLAEILPARLAHALAETREWTRSPDRGHEGKGNSVSGSFLHA